METIIELVSKCEDKHFGAFSDVIAENSPNEDLYILVRGAVEILKGDVSINKVNTSGTVFGEVAALLNLPHMATVRTTEPSHFKVVRNARPFLIKNPGLFRELAQILAWRLVFTSNKLAVHQRDFLEMTKSMSVETDEPATMLRRFQEYWKESWNLFEQQKYRDAGIPCDHLKLMQFDPGNIIIQQGELDQRAFIVRTGSVEIVKNDVSLFMVWDKGVLFGEISALLGTGHTATVRALEHCTLQVVENINELFSAHPQIAWYITALLAKRLLDANRFLAGLKIQFNRLESQISKENASVMKRFMENCDRMLVAGKPRRKS